jgi:protein-S-isoprenylcysteine O-methyltransferase Ste14
VAVEQGPGVRWPPPLIFLLGLGVAWFLNRQLPFEIDGAGASWPQIGLGAVLLLTGVALIAWGVRTLLRSGTTLRPDRPASKLVVEGPYRFTRNPIYLGFTAAYVGVAILTNVAWPIVILPVVLIMLTMTAIEHEEEHLLATFGDGYADYTRRVRRWL